MTATENARRWLRRYKVHPTERNRTTADVWLILSGPVRARPGLVYDLADQVDRIAPDRDAADQAAE